MNYGKLNPYNDAEISFPGFQRIHDFTATGSESTSAASVDSSTELDYIVLIFNPKDEQPLLRLNADSGANYGNQVISNISGTISASRDTTATVISTFNIGWLTYFLTCPVGFIRASTAQLMTYSSGTTISNTRLVGAVWNSTATVTSINLTAASGNFTSGTRFIVFARRSQS